MSALDETHGPARRSWVSSANNHPDFPIQNLPLGVFSPTGGGKRVGAERVVRPRRGPAPGAPPPAFGAAGQRRRRSGAPVRAACCRGLGAGLIRARVFQPLDSVPEFLRTWTSWGVTFGYFFAQGTISVILAWLPTYRTKVKQFSIMNVGCGATRSYFTSVISQAAGLLAIGAVVEDSRHDAEHQRAVVIQAARQCGGTSRQGLCAG